MKILLDTHIAVWLASDLAQLRPSELAVTMEPDNEIAVSSVSIWEVRIKWSKFFRTGERKLPISAADLLLALRRMNFAVLPLAPEHAAAQLRIPLDHADPFDNLLLTIAQEMDGRLLTRDADLRGHPLAYHAD